MPERAAGRRRRGAGSRRLNTPARDGAVEAFADETLESAIAGLGERLGLDLTGHDVILRARRRGRRGPDGTR